ncbi:hypothetical protein [Streptomyces chartreusis]|uniref:hypothetical protein n=1 Tax=Streptomyces chartreusis TaxID=1969 RepID=UPI002E16C89F
MSEAFRSYIFNDLLTKDESVPYTVSFGSGLAPSPAVRGDGTHYHHVKDVCPDPAHDLVYMVDTKDELHEFDARTLAYRGRVTYSGGDRFRAVALAGGYRQKAFVNQRLYAVGLDQAGAATVFTFGLKNGSRVGTGSAQVINGCTQRPTGIAVSQDGLHQFVITYTDDGVDGLRVVNLEDSHSVLAGEGTGRRPDVHEGFFNAVTRAKTVPRPSGIAVSNGQHPYVLISNHTEQVTAIGLDALDVPVTVTLSSQAWDPVHVRDEIFALRSMGVVLFVDAARGKQVASVALPVDPVGQDFRNTSIGVAGEYLYACYCAYGKYGAKKGRVVAIRRSDFAIEGQPAEYEPSGGWDPYWDMWICPPLES